jgi:hypothetical protein
VKEITKMEPTKTTQDTPQTEAEAWALIDTLHLKHVAALPAERQQEANDAHAATTLIAKGFIAQSVILVEHGKQCPHGKEHDHVTEPTTPRDAYAAAVAVTAFVAAMGLEGVQVLCDGLLDELHPRPRLTLDANVVVPLNRATRRARR